MRMKRTFSIVLALLLLGAGCQAPSLTTPTGVARTYAARKAMDLYRTSHALCEFCGSGKRVEVHHVIPVSEDASLQADTNNFVSLCRPCHEVVGHANNFQHHVINVRELCERVMIAK